MKTTDEQIGYDKIVLEKLRVGITTRVSKHLLDSNVDVLDTVANHIEIDVRGYIWAEKESLRHLEVKYPKDWWESCKEHFLPKWLLDMFPVQYTTVILDVRAIYPTLSHLDNQPVLIIRRS